MVKRGPDSYGPALGKQIITFIDDINAPGFDRYGAQPPIEILRQYLDFHGWYDRKTNVFKNVSGMQIIGALQGDFFYIKLIYW